jgi:OmpA-OmpF porin, OOP family
VRSSFDGNAVSVGGTIPDADRDRIISYLKSTLGPQFVFATIAGTGATKTAIASPSLKSGVSDKKPVSTPEQSTLNLPTIYFATNSAEVSSDSKAFLEQAVVLMKQLPAGTVVRISGFTESTGNLTTNMKLSQNPAILSANGYGIYHSVASENGTMEGRSSTMMQGRLREDRRVEFRIAQQ